MILNVIQIVKQILKKTNELNEIKKVEIEGNRFIENPKKLLNENESENVSMKMRVRIRVRVRV